MVEIDPSAEYVMTTVRKCLETPAMGSTVSEQAGPKKVDPVIVLKGKNNSGCTVLT
jgi:hypothetical protein